MPPPPHLHLARAATDVYRRPSHWMAYHDGGTSATARRPSWRDASPVRRGGRAPTADLSAYSSAASGLAHGPDDHIEVVVEPDDDGGDDDTQSTRYRSDRLSSRDDRYTMSSADKRRHRHRHSRRRSRPRYADDGRRCLSNSASPARASSERAAERSASSPHGRRRPLPDVIEDSRPPVSSLRSVVRRRQRSADKSANKPRSTSTLRSGRSRAGSVSGGPSGILSSIFGAPSSRRASPEKRAKEPKAAKRVDCVICMGDVSPSKAARLKCGHAMCRPCLDRVFRLSIADPQHMPPRCCTQDHIPLRHVDRMFDDSFKKMWNRKFAEFSTKNRLYCPSRRCGEWIKPASIHQENGRKMARCGRCKTKVCAACNAKWHGSDDCPKDEETARLLAQAQEEGWKRCYRCKAIVELKEGCNHMTCRCGAEFCMICGVKWRGCDCPMFNDGGGFRADVLEHMNVAAPQTRGALHGVFDGDGDGDGDGGPAPAELRGHHPVATMSLPVRPRPQSYQEEMLLRRLQEQRDADMARLVQHAVGQYDGHDVGGRFRVSMPPLRATTLDRGVDYVARGSRANAGDSMERRLAGRLSEKRPGKAMLPGSAPGSGLGPMPPAMRAPPAAMGHMGMGMGMGMGRGLRQHSIEEELYSNNNKIAINSSPRSERLVSGHGRASRTYEDEAEIYRPRSRRHAREDRPRSSDMAGLSGPAQGMNRVSQWRSFVEPGVPEGESTIGHG